MPEPSASTRVRYLPGSDSTTTAETSIQGCVRSMAVSMTGYALGRALLTTKV
jgi:hypothetical protein